MDDNKKIPSKLVSIGIPTYKRPQMLKRTLDCFCNQTYRNIEIIVSDDNSQMPEVEELLREYSLKDKRIKYRLRKDGNHAGENYKYVLDQASGEYFMWAADDDYREQEFVETLVDLLDKNDSAVSAFCSIKLNNNPNIFDYIPKYNGLSSDNLETRIKTYLSINDGVLGKDSIVYSLHRKENIKKCYEEVYSYSSIIDNYYADNYLNLNILMKGPIVFSEKCLFVGTADNYKFYRNHFKRGNFIETIIILIKKYSSLIYKLFVYGGYVMSVLMRSKTSYIFKVKIFIYYAIYIIKLILRNTFEHLFEIRHWQKILGLKNKNI